MRRCVVGYYVSTALNAFVGGNAESIARFTSLTDCGSWKAHLSQAAADCTVSHRPRQNRLTTVHYPTNRPTGTGPSSRATAGWRGSDDILRGGCCARCRESTRSGSPSWTDLSRTDDSKYLPRETCASPPIVRRLIQEEQSAVILRRMGMVLMAGSLGTRSDLGVPRCWVWRTGPGMDLIGRIVSSGGPRSA